MRTKEAGLNTKARRHEAGSGGRRRVGEVDLVLFLFLKWKMRGLRTESEPTSGSSWLRAFVFNRLRHDHRSAPMRTTCAGRAHIEKRRRAAALQMGGLRVGRPLDCGYDLRRYTTDTRGGLRNVTPKWQRAGKASGGGFAATRLRRRNGPRWRRGVAWLG